MHNGLSNSVRITWFDRDKILNTLRKAIRELVASHPEIEAVLLFGSLARGDTVPGSDADLLVILRDSELPFRERIPRYIPDYCGIDVDVFPYTKEEISEMLKEGHHFIKRALSEGLELFRRESSNRGGAGL